MNKSAANLSSVLMASALALVPTVQALVCDESYHFQTAHEVILTGKTTATLSDSSKKSLTKAMTGTTILHDDTEYQMITDFAGMSACDAWKKTSIDQAYRKKGDAGIVKRTEANHFTKLNAGNYPGPDPIPLDYWFGFTENGTSEPISIYEIIGKSPGDPLLHVWYGNATMKKEIRQAGVGTILRTLTYRFLQLNNHVDSAALRNVLLEGWKTEKDNDTQTVSIRLQLIKVNYDSLPSPVAVRAPARSKPAGLQASQAGSLVFLRPGEGAAVPKEPLGLFNMMGHRIATLHPTGYLYQWNGRTGAGAAAPTGVYFVQSGSRILGKFFYSR